VYYHKVATDFHTIISKHKEPSGTLLDVGCACGLLMKELGELGWRTYGVEVSDSAAAFAREQLGLDVATGTLMGAHFPDKEFDLIIAKDVLEHGSRNEESSERLERLVSSDTGEREAKRILPGSTLNRSTKPR